MSFEYFKNMTPGLAVFLFAAAGSLIFPSWPMTAFTLIGFMAYGLERGEVLFREVTEEKKHELNMVMLQNQIDDLKKEQESLKRLAEDAKTAINGAKLSNSILPKSMRAGFGGN